MHRIESIECGRIRHTWMSDADSSTDPVLFLIAQNQVFFIPSMHWNSETNNCLSTIWNTVHTAQRLVRCRIGSTVNFDTHMLAMQQNHRFKHAIQMQSVVDYVSCFNIWHGDNCPTCMPSSRCDSQSSSIVQMHWIDHFHRPESICSLVFCIAVQWYADGSDTVEVNAIGVHMEFI